jgi:hypothetical protein
MPLRIALAALVLCLSGCGPDMLTSEPGAGYIANGQSVLVDDGRCPAGQVSKVTGPANLTSGRTYACVRKPSGGLF